MAEATFIFIPTYVLLCHWTRLRPAAILFLLKGNVSPAVPTPVILSFFLVRYRCSAKRWAAWFKLQSKLRFASLRLSFICALPTAGCVRPLEGNLELWKDGPAGQSASCQMARYLSTQDGHVHVIWFPFCLDFGEPTKQKQIYTSLRFCDT